MTRYVDLEGEELTMFVGPLEAVILRACWDGCASVPTIYDYVQRHYTGVNSGKRVAYTTVASVVTRLMKRNLLVRGGKRTKTQTYSYAPRVASERVFVEHCVVQTVRRLMMFYSGQTSVAFHEAIATLVDAELDAAGGN